MLWFLAVRSVESWLLNWGLNLHPLHRKAKSRPLDDTGSPLWYVLKCGSSNLLFFKSVLAIWSPLQFHMNLMTGFCTVGKGCWTFQRLC